MTGRNLYFFALCLVLSLAAVGVLLVIPGCYEEEVSSQGTTAKTPVQTAAPPNQSLPQRGKPRLAAPPAYALFGMIYVNTANNREYIYDGANWVPHDQSVDDYYRSMESVKARMAQNQVIPTDCAVTPATPTGAHGLPQYAGGPTKHGSYECKVCHYVGGVFMFDRNGLAVAPGNPYPAFEATGKTCSNVACHGMYSGTYYYYFPGGDGEPELKSVSYAGNGGSTTSWYAAGAMACAACHGNPPRNGAWHSGYHAGTPTSPSNQCQFCHPDATGSNGQGTAITNPALHGNGTVNVQARFTSSCFGCH